MDVVDCYKGILRWLTCFAGPFLCKLTVSRCLFLRQLSEVLNIGQCFDCLHFILTGAVAWCDFAPRYQSGCCSYAILAVQWQCGINNDSCNVVCLWIYESTEWKYCKSSSRIIHACISWCCWARYMWGMHHSIVMRVGIKAKNAGVAPVCLIDSQYTCPFHWGCRQNYSGWTAMSLHLLDGRRMYARWNIQWLPAFLLIAFLWCSITNLSKLQASRQGKMQAAMCFKSVRMQDTCCCQLMMHWGKRALLWCSSCTGVSHHGYW